MQASWDEVQDEMLSGTWHVLHFIGHGDYDLTSDQGVIALVGDNGGPHLVEADRLADLLNRATPTPRLVVLNSCKSGRSGASDLFSSTAATLVKRGINAVAAMQFTVSDAAAWIQNLADVGVDYTVSRGQLVTWLNNPEYTPYPSLAEVLMNLLGGRGLRRPVAIDAIASNYEELAPSPRRLQELDFDILEAAVLGGFSHRYGEDPVDFESILKPAG